MPGRLAAFPDDRESATIWLSPLFNDRQRLVPIKPVAPFIKTLIWTSKVSASTALKHRQARCRRQDRDQKSRVSTLEAQSSIDRNLDVIAQNLDNTGYGSS